MLSFGILAFVFLAGAVIGCAACASLALGLFAENFGEFDDDPDQACEAAPEERVF